MKKIYRLNTFCYEAKVKDVPVSGCTFNIRTNKSGFEVEAEAFINAEAVRSAGKEIYEAENILYFLTLNETKNYINKYRSAICDINEWEDVTGRHVELKEAELTEITVNSELLLAAAADEDVDVEDTDELLKFFAENEDYYKLGEDCVEFLPPADTVTVDSDDRDYWKDDEVSSDFNSFGDFCEFYKKELAYRDTRFEIDYESATLGDVKKLFDTAGESSK